MVRDSDPVMSPGSDTADERAPATDPPKENPSIREPPVPHFYLPTLLTLQTTRY